jgi:protein SCO1/2
MTLPAATLGLWAAATLLWWAFAFAPLPSTPPPWLTAARSACFGAIETGPPDAQGWILLVAAPLSFLLALLALWGWELAASLRHVARSRWGRVACAVLLTATVVEATWVSAKLRAALASAQWDTASATPGALPADYPRQAATPPEFSLIDQHGETLRLGALVGRPVVISFVFGHCESLCPLIVEALKTAAPGDGVAVLLVTLDPWRDTPGTLPALARRWALPPHFHVLTSHHPADVVAVARAFGVPSIRDDTSGDITHPGLVFVVDAAGRLAYTFNSPPAGWLRDALHRLG